MFNQNNNLIVGDFIQINEKEALQVDKITWKFILFEVFKWRDNQFKSEGYYIQDFKKEWQLAK